MKNILKGTLLGLITIPMLSFQALAADVSIGIVNTQVIVEKSSLYSAVRKADQELKSLEDNFKKDYMDRMGKLQQAQQQNKPRAELEKLVKQYEKELKSKQESAYKTLQSKQRNLQVMKEQLKSKVDSAVKDIAKQKKLTYIVDKQAMLFGGVDITNEVLAKVK